MQESNQAVWTLWRLSGKKIHQLFEEMTTSLQRDLPRTHARNLRHILLYFHWVLSEKDSYDVHFHKLFLCQFIPNRRRQKHPICLSWWYDSDLHFLVALDWRESNMCKHKIMNEIIECFA